MVDTNFAGLSFRKNEWGQLVLVMPDGAEHPGIDPVRCFPLTDPDHVIALLDPEGKEVICLPSLEVLNPESREFIRRELAERDFVPVIQKIMTTSAPYPPCIWNVETDRGKTSFHLESEEAGGDGNQGIATAGAPPALRPVPEDRVDGRPAVALAGCSSACG